ncbi:MAG: hypothetical protein ABL958_10065 [Bdellovibrionia bacterium]
MAANTLAPIDIELITKKAVLQKLQIQVRTVITNFWSMPTKERARHLNEIQKSLESFQRFFDKLKSANIQNTGTRFVADNLRQSFNSLQAQWRKFETSLNSTAS